MKETTWYNRVMMRASSSSFSIGQLAAAAGVPTTTLRYYERIGLLKPIARARNNYRYYTAASLDRLRFIRAAQAAGLSLEDTAHLIRQSDDADALCPEVQVILRQRLAEVGERMRELRSIKSAIESALETCQCAPGAGLCAQVGKLARG